MKGFEQLTVADIERRNLKISEVKKPKYGNTKFFFDGHMFDSKKEAARWGELKLLEKAGHIARLKRQQSFELVTVHTDIRGNIWEPIQSVIVVAHWIADFTYDELSVEKTQFVAEDVKGHKTAGYKAKKRHFEAQYGIQIRET